MERVRTFVGLVAVAIGAALLFERIGGTSHALNLLRSWWPLAIVALGALNLLRMVERPWALIGPLLTVTVGVVLLRWISHPQHRDFVPRVWPAALLLFGGALVVSGVDWSAADLSRRGDLRRVIWLRGERIASQAKPFWHATITIALGDLELDLRRANLHRSGVFVNLNVVFGAARVLLPADVHVRIRRPFFPGGIAPREDPPPSSTPPRFVTLSVVGLLGRVALDTTAPTSSPTEPKEESY
jgi:LiaF transmembrane domain